MRNGLIDYWPLILRFAMLLVFLFLQFYTGIGDICVPPSGLVSSELPVHITLSSSLEIISQDA